MKKYILYGLMLIITVALLVVGYMYLTLTPDTSAIEHIQKLQKGPNDFIEVGNDIHVQSADDIAYKVTGEDFLLIYYGDQVITVTPKCFSDAKFMSALKKVGIVIETHKEEGKETLYRVTYWGTPVVKYV